MLGVPNSAGTIIMVQSCHTLGWLLAKVCGTISVLYFITLTTHPFT